MDGIIRIDDFSLLVWKPNFLIPIFSRCLIVESQNLSSVGFSDDVGSNEFDSVYRNQNLNQELSIKKSSSRKHSICWLVVELGLIHHPEKNRIQKNWTHF